MNAIKKISALEILDSRGNPTVKATVALENGILGSAAVPSGASTGKYEALELRDSDTRYGGQGVLTACDNIEKNISKEISGIDAFDQKKIDEILVEMDGTENKSNLGANATLAVSLAAARAAAKSENTPLFEYLAKNYSFRKPKNIPTAFFNILNGGAHADSGLSIQEFQIIPREFENFSEKVRVASEIFHKLKELLVGAGFSAGVGDEGGFAPKLESNVEALDYVEKAIEESGYSFAGTVSIGIDAAASSFFESSQSSYILKPENISLEPERLIALYQEWKKKYKIFSIEDGLAEDDFESWKMMNGKMGDNTLIVGDDLLATNKNRLEKALSFSAINAAIVKPNQIGTLSETMEFIKKCQKNKIKIVVSHRSGETEDDFIADLAVAAGAEFVKFGAPCRGERTAKYNRLLEIENEIK
ncbi:MAG: phosphopyruvate hydratase [Candidatus Moranbacteria bacterium RIFOXYB1_FULL_43_19]|nr:MAG: phosphopyruvate hydratase [Candidatus Moranbacteria bacterium RIFOXYB1_FULL_43_19]OGI33821.1 MAG: phosphopyruvate hydratase [Candidatus Moranbacteria bacterium RIFOXYC1_FULL_44_13]OGI38769.1 MAG: phosphopyruvate hydratase [Candidatus Moranbacteria bacterium RIFOXYD1_FULL_44_12]